MDVGIYMINLYVSEGIHHNTNNDVLYDTELKARYACQMHGCKFDHCIVLLC